jgi:glycosyltransferase involved in cell wall biosynthesis
MNRRIRVLQVISRLAVGGLPKVVVEVCEQIDDRRFECLLVAGRAGAGEGDILDIERRTKVTPILIPELGRSLSPARDLRALTKMIGVMRRFRPDIVHTHAAKPGAVGRLAALAAHVPIRVHSYHGHVFSGYFSSPVSKLVATVERQLGRITAAVLVPGDSQRDEIADRYRVVPASKVRIVPYAVDTDYFGQRLDRATHRARLGIPATARVIGSVGRMAAVKNHALLVAAFERLCVVQGFDDVHLLIVGDGECRRDIEERVARLPAANRVHILPWLADLREAFSAMDVLAVTSKNEGMPVAALEAMAAHVCVVSTMAGGAVDLVVHEDTGLLVPTHSPEDVSAELARVLTDSALRARLTERARHRVVDRHGKVVHVRALEQLYETLFADASLRDGLRRQDAVSRSEPVPSQSRH